MHTVAIVRKPGRNFAEGITTSGLGRPDFEKALAQHARYCEALEKCGLKLIMLEADERYPDGCFVEDTAIVTDEVAIITRPGALSRRGEEKSISEILQEFRKTERIKAPGTVDGGDIMRAEDHFYIGRSGLTNSEGARQLSEILSQYGYTTSEITVETVPHLKSGITYPGKGIFVSIDEFCGKIPGGHIIKVLPEESYASNCLQVNDRLLVAAGFPGTEGSLIAAGFSTVSLDMSEFRKMDGALTCLSILI